MAITALAWLPSEERVGRHTDGHYEHEKRRNLIRSVLSSCAGPPCLVRFIYLTAWRIRTNERADVTNTST